MTNYFNDIFIKNKTALYSEDEIKNSDSLGIKDAILFYNGSTGIAKKRFSSRFCREKIEFAYMGNSISIYFSKYKFRQNILVSLSEIYLFQPSGENIAKTNNSEFHLKTDSLFERVFFEETTFKEGGLGFIDEDKISLRELNCTLEDFWYSLIDEKGVNIKNYKSYYRKDITEENIKDLEVYMGFEFPEPYRTFLFETNGGYAGNWNIYNKTFFLGKNTTLTAMYQLFDMIGIYEYFALFSEDDYFNEKINRANNLIPIGLDGDTGVFLIGAKGTTKEGKVYYYDYDSFTDEEDPSSDECIGFVCDSFQEYLDGYFNPEN